MLILFLLPIEPNIHLCNLCHVCCSGERLSSSFRVNFLYNYLELISLLMTLEHCYLLSHQLQQPLELHLLLYNSEATGLVLRYCTTFGQQYKGFSIYAFLYTLVKMLSVHHGCFVALKKWLLGLVPTFGYQTSNWALIIAWN